MPRICFLLLALCPVFGADNLRCSPNRVSTTIDPRPTTLEIPEIRSFKRPPRKPHPADQVHRPSPPA